MDLMYLQCPGKSEKQSIKQFNYFYQTAIFGLVQAELFITLVNLSHSTICQINNLHFKTGRKARGRTAKGASDLDIFSSAIAFFCCCQGKSCTDQFKIFFFLASKLFFGPRGIFTGPGHLLEVKPSGCVFFSTSLLFISLYWLLQLLIE